MLKRIYLKTARSMSRDWLESVAVSYDAGDRARMRPIHRALIAIALRDMA